GETYNVGGRNERRNIEVVQTICGILDELMPANAPYSDLITFVTDRPGHDARYAIDATRSETESGWRASENFDTGIRKTVQWYLDNAWWWQPSRERYNGERSGTIARAAEVQPGLAVIPIGRPQLDLAVSETIAPASAAARPDVIVSAAAYTAVDRAESDAVAAFRVNGEAPGAIAAAAAALGVPVIHIST
ncbi:hypothetical protein OY671_009337, partial [Metschnikowia pulcherrima]